MTILNIREHGVEIKQDFLSPEKIKAVIAEIDAYDEAVPKYGIRNAEKKFPSISEIVHSKRLIDLAYGILSSSPQVVRVIFFDKTPDKNWLVSWHQDKTVAVTDKFDMDGWGPWSLKEGVHHVRPPLTVLNEMVTFRLHLDNADSDNGCLKVITGSHEIGILKQQPLSELVNKSEPVFCEVKAGDAVIMRPHILHSSSKSVSPSHRRVIHIEYSGFGLPGNISWA